jgi:hypothetical protein
MREPVTTTVSTFDELSELDACAYAASVAAADAIAQTNVETINRPRNDLIFIVTPPKNFATNPRSPQPSLAKPCSRTNFEDATPAFKK